MADFTTLQQMVAANMPEKVKDPFANFGEGFATGSKIGIEQQKVNNDQQKNIAEMALRQQGMKQEAGFRQQEITNKTNEMRTGSLKGIADAYADGDTGMGKLLADNHKDMAQKYGWKDQPWVDAIGKSADVRQGILSNIDPTQLKDPAYNAKLTSMLDAAGGNPMKINEVMKGLSGQAQQRANTQIMFQNKEKLDADKHINALTGYANKYATPDEAKIVSDPNMIGTPEYAQAVSSFTARAASANQTKDALGNQKTQSETNKNNIGSDLKVKQDQDKVFNPIEQNLKTDLAASRRLHHADGMLQDGAKWPQFHLAVDDILYGVKNSGRMTQQEQNSLGMNDLEKFAGIVKGYVTEKKEGGPSPALLQQYRDIKDRLQKDITDPAAEDFVKYANGRVSTGRVDEQQAKERFESLFPGKTWEQTKGGMGIGKSKQGSNQGAGNSQGGQPPSHSPSLIQDNINKVLRGGNQQQIDALKKAYPKYDYSGGTNGP